MNDVQIQLVQDSFTKVAPIADTAAQLFYQRLFLLDAESEILFENSDMHSQGQKLMKMVGHAVGSLDDLEPLIPVVQKLGVRHKISGVQPSHYDTVGQALLWTLEQGLGDDFTPEVSEAWASAYGLLSGVMQAAAQSKQLERA